ncbi:MAG TPA: anhydro-N-acetylmuramic acid kinase [Salinimicrobium sp.]|nr:anhydro-N-acetylmuramic acid kinase [Salinimicrobium sp.]
MKKWNYQVLGIMSGTSLDGIDVALLDFQKTEKWTADIIVAETIPYPENWKKILSEAVFYSDENLDELNRKYTFYLADVISNFIKKYKLKDLDAVCSHGHTIKHEPQNNFTLQIGNLPELAKMIDQTVVCDFRVQDVQFGGQGAPLVPVGDELLFSEYEACLNLGGFANISRNINGKRIAYDICPVNTVLNFLAEKLHFPYDKDGKIAASGELDEKLLQNLNELEFYHQPPPKSLGIEWVNQNIFPLLSKNGNIESFLRTYTIHAATQIAKELDEKPDSQILVTGGGAFNRFLISEIQKRTENALIIPNAKMVNYKEALIFGFLGVLRLRDEINVLKSVTGASKDHSSGKIFIPNSHF